LDWWSFLLGIGSASLIFGVLTVGFVYCLGLSVEGWRPTHCPNPNCGLEDDPTAAYSHFSFRFEKGCLWLICPKCGTMFRPSKTLDGMEKYK